MTASLGLYDAISRIYLQYNSLCVINGSKTAAFVKTTKNTMFSDPAKSDLKKMFLKFWRMESKVPLETKDVCSQHVNSTVARKYRPKKNHIFSNFGWALFTVWFNIYSWGILDWGRTYNWAVSILLLVAQVIRALEAYLDEGQSFLHCTLINCSSPRSGVHLSVFFGWFCVFELQVLCIRYKFSICPRCLK